MICLLLEDFKSRGRFSSSLYHWSVWVHGLFELFLSRISAAHKKKSTQLPFKHYIQDLFIKHPRAEKCFISVYSHLTAASHPCGRAAAFHLVPGPLSTCSTTTKFVAPLPWPKSRVLSSARTGDFCFWVCFVNMGVAWGFVNLWISSCLVIESSFLLF